jgi:hypothetical protein
MPLRFMCEPGIGLCQTKECVAVEQDFLIPERAPECVVRQVSSVSVIPPSIINAYLETNYCVFGEFPFVMRIAIANEALAKLYKRYDASCGVFVTASNPYSKNVGEALNSARQAELSKELERRKLIFFEGAGKHPTGTWQSEPSYFVLGLSLDAAKDLGKKYEQNAIVWCGADAVPELVLLR